MSTIRDSRQFVGSKIAVFCGNQIVTYLRDDFDHIPDPGLWDLPGGEREPGETALACVLRETLEEFSIQLGPDQIIHESSYPSHQPGRADVAFFAAQVDQQMIDAIIFGDEGQEWRMMPVAEFLDRDDAVVELQRAVRRLMPSLQVR